MCYKAKSPLGRKDVHEFFWQIARRAKFGAAKHASTLRNCKVVERAYIAKNFIAGNRIKGMMMTAAYVMIDSQMSKNLLTLCCIGYLVVHMLFADFVVTNHFVSNSLDKAYVRMAYEYITGYEQKNHTTVQNLCMINDTNAPARYREVSYVSDQINERSLGILTVSIMEVVTGRKFNKVEMDPEIYATYFDGKNWDYFDPYEQIIIIGDTAYWCMF